MHNYANPQGFFWDENYHVASAQKYLHGVYFMEPHPPLGKMLIAAGEALLGQNEQTDQFITTDYGRNPPPEFNFVGYRFFPTLLAWFNALIIFNIFYLLTRRSIWAMLLSFLYVFDNALIVHQRAAMLESTLHFGILAMIMFWLYLVQNKVQRKQEWLYAIGCGLSFGIAISTKANGLIMILLWVALLPLFIKEWRRLAKLSAWFIGSAAVLYCSVWYLHFAIGSTVQPELPDNGYYQASTEYKTILNEGSTANPLNFATMLSDSLAFLPHYARGVPKLDLCKEGENGSPWFYWPLGGRSINYRWTSQPQLDAYQYLYLQANPAVWWLSLLAVLVSVSLLLAWLLLPLKTPLKQPWLLATFTGMYLAYMLTMARIDRVMYLYHYFVPLLFAFILVALVLNELTQFWRYKFNGTSKTYTALGIAVLVFATFQYYRPLTYYEPLRDEAVQQRAILPVWDLHCVRCEHERYLHPNTCN